MNDTARCTSTLAPPSAPVQVRGRLFRKYVALFVVVVALALLLNGASEIWFTYQEHKAALIRIQHEQAESAAAKIEQFIREIENQIGWTTQLPWAASALEQRRFDALRLLRQVPAITELAQLDAAGREQLRVSRLAMDVIGSGADYSKDARFTEAVAHKIYYGPVYFRRESEPYMTLAMAGTRRDAGVSVAEVNLKFIWDVVSQIKVGEHGQAYVIDAQSRLIAYPDISQVLRNTDMSHLAQVQAARAGASGLSPDDVQEAQDLRGRRVLTAYAPVPPLNWLVFVELPRAEAYAPLYGSIERSGTLLLAALAFAILAGLVLARKMVGPIQALRAGAARIGGGDLAQRIAIKTGDELEGLADQFNDMAGRLQESYADLEKKVDVRTRELSEALEQQTATSEVLGVISSSPGELQPVFEAILENATRLCDASFGTLYLYEGGAFRIVATHHVPSEFLEARRQSPLIYPAEGTGFARIVATRQVVHFLDVREQDAYRANPAQAQFVERSGARTLIDVPMLKENDLVGAIAIYRTEVRPFSDKQIALVTNFAAQAVIAIENTRLLNELRESLEQQTATSEVLGVISSSPGELDPVFNAIVNSATRICEAEFGSLFIFDNDTFRSVFNRAPPGGLPELREQPVISLRDIPRNPLARLARTKEVQHIADLRTEEGYLERNAKLVELVETSGARSILIVPMLKEDNLVGVITIYRREVRPFTDKQIELVKGFAAQAVIAIENARLLSELRARTDELGRSVQELRALGDVSEAINSTLDLETVLRTIVTKAVELSVTDAGAIYVFDDDRGEFRLRATYGMSEAMIAAISDRHIGVGDANIGEATRRREPIQIADLREVPGSALNDIILGFGYRALLIVPLLRPDRIVGALVVRRKAPGTFAAGTVDLLQTFADQSVLAIQNARLFREIEEKSRQVELASRHKSQFLANMSHELRTPLNAILGYSELILDNIYGEPSDKMRSVLERVQSNGRHLLGLINSVLDLSKIEAGQLTLSINDYSLKEVVQNVFVAVESLATAKRLALKINLPAALPTGRGDEQRITQVLLNLVGNAIKFTETGEVAIAASAENGAFTVAVRDTGPGIALADQTRIFEEFQQADNSSTRSKGGTGLGLAISKRFIEMHGGRILVDSEVGRGSTFTISLPINASREEPRP